MIRIRLLLPVALVGAVLLAGCSSGGPTADPAADAAAGTTAAPLSVVASTNVWASVAQAVGGDAVSVTSVLDDPNTDPHSFEASPRVKLAMSKAALVIVNGGGYDDWAVSTVESLDPVPTVIDATSSSGLDSSVEGFNEHVFYDLTAVAAVADAIAGELGTADPAQAGTFTANAATFTASLRGLEDELRALGARYPDTKVVATEPVPGYLIQTLGFTDVTPPSFSAAVEAQSEVSVKDLADTEGLLTSGTATLLFDNVQTGGPVTDRLVAAAESAGVGVVGVSEMIPAGVPDYLTWMRGNLAGVATALGAQA
ncbi:MAG: zinc ABC transporter substrate-binding protein [Nakamurella sp.]